MRREHRAGGKGEDAKDDGVRRRTEGGPGREGRQPGVTASQRQEEAKTAKRGRQSGGRNAEGGGVRGPPLCVVFCAFQAILARQPVSRLLALLPRPLSPAPRARNPPPFLFVAHHRLLAVKKKKEILTTEEKLISTAGSCRLDIARPRPTLLLFVRNTDINVRTCLLLASTREKRSFNSGFA